MDEPKRIWAEHTGYFKRGDVYHNGGKWNDCADDGFIEYVRIDVYRALEAKLAALLPPASP